MERLNCSIERFSNISIGVVLLLGAIGLTLISFFILPVFGLIFSIPIFIVAVIFILAPRSKSCALIADKLAGKKAA